MSGDAHVQFWEGLGVRLPGATQHENIRSVFKEIAGYP
jgi:hypothetical protein